MIIAGVEEAGRGPVIGPMIMAIACMDHKDEFKLKTMGVKDSKLLLPEQREKLYHQIKDLCRFEIVRVEPEEIDAAVGSGGATNLNWLEADKTALLINKLRPEKVILDCPSTNLDSYRAYIVKKLDYKPKLVVEHKADVNYPVVSAASILAKVCRDNEIKKLKARFGVDFGSGYSSDSISSEFVKKNFDKYPFFRKSWETWKSARLMASQKKLSKF